MNSSSWEAHNMATFELDFLTFHWQKRYFKKKYCSVFITSCLASDISFKLNKNLKQAPTQILKFWCKRKSSFISQLYRELGKIVKA